MSGWLPPGVTDADIDRAAPQNEPFYCIGIPRCYEQNLNLVQCEFCKFEEQQQEPDDD